jgi:hypothetical protein
MTFSILRPVLITAAAAWTFAAAQAQQPATPPPAAPPAAPAAPAAAPVAQSPAWANLPKMVLERQFSGPLQDTVIQRWRDPVDGATCFLYLPITAPHSPTTASGFVQYGSNTIGSISCIPGAAGKPAAPRTPAAAPKQ